ncbi:transposase [Cyclobacterium sp.]|uniref:transposase n=1 Tax=Cyclobacterium sp. TaxID=1966343 RepID=UPI0019ACE92B|nr:transposase [Cyclobacterium sp.]MBD3626682.1 transposase [Cyclobacterium sp.]
MDRYKNKYRNASARAQWWDYGWNGAYFITICTRGREHFFGEIDNGIMKLSPMGVIADILWHEIPNHASFVGLGDFVVMPNHIHGILILDKPEVENDGRVDGPNVVGTGHAPSLQSSQIPWKQMNNKTPNSPTIGQTRFQNIGKNTVSSIIGSYKSAVTKHANRLGLENGWQSRFHDHIIRNDAAYQRISDYIINNPVNWKGDKFNSK